MTLSKVKLHPKGIKRSLGIARGIFFSTGPFTNHRWLWHLVFPQHHEHPFESVLPVFWRSTSTVQDGPLLVINGVITPIIWVI